MVKSESRAFFLLALLFVFLVLKSADAKTEEFYYDETCPEAENIVRDTVASHFMANWSVPAALLRLFFHDCFVEGCDGSILLDESPGGGLTEKEAAPNKDSVRGFEVIDAAKAALEDACPGTVSCADIVALAARDAVVLLGALDFVMPTGRFDGRRSQKSEAERLLPSPSFNAQQLKQNFAAQNLSAEDLVYLSGGHTIGQSHCRFFTDRLYNFSSTGKPDPSLNPAYLAELRRACPRGGPFKSRVALDKRSEFVFDNNYYKNLQRGNGLLSSDSALVADRETRNIVKRVARREMRFQFKFQTSLVKMGNIKVKSEADGEIRHSCRSVNPRSLSIDII